MIPLVGIDAALVDLVVVLVVEVVVLLLLVVTARELAYCEFIVEDP